MKLKYYFIFALTTFVIASTFAMTIPSQAFAQNPNSGNPHDPGEAGNPHDFPNCSGNPHDDDSGHQHHGSCPGTH